MSDYYSEKLSAKKLKKCYDIAPPRVKQYLEAEFAYVLEYIKPDDRVLELGCGYGRVLSCLSSIDLSIYGIDTSLESLMMAKSFEPAGKHFHLANMDAGSLGFADNVFDVVLCIQNGISAIKINPEILLSEALRVARPKGIIMFSSYSEKFWDERLNWFELQSKEGLLGEIDYDATGNGVIVCKDGFRSDTFRPDDFIKLANEFNLDVKIEEIDSSSIFCRFIVDKFF
ncbi:MAG: class I SAM-dependent methyltransferase [candidate division Zixibacteria bacterium]